MQSFLVQQRLREECAVRTTAVSVEGEVIGRLQCSCLLDSHDLVVSIVH